MRYRTRNPLGSWMPSYRLLILMYVLAGSAAVLVVLFFTTTATVKLSSSVCGRVCHAINPQYQSWKRSSHAGVSCIRCHAPGGPLALLRQVFVDQPTIGLKLLRDRFDKPINADSEYSRQVPNKACEGCHGSVVNSKNRRDPARHATHLAAKIDCTACHNRVAHENAERFGPLTRWNPLFKYRDFAKMNPGCWRCHTTTRKYRDEKALNTLPKMPPTDCLACHKKVIKPTGGPLNHGKKGGALWVNGKSGHGFAARADFDACLPCHRRAKEATGPDTPDCTACHLGVTMPHNIPRWRKYYVQSPDAPQWLVIHPDASKDRIQACLLCHEQGPAENLCQSCHHGRFYRGSEKIGLAWAARHAAAGNVSQTGCQRCHMMEYCAYCHLYGTKPQRGTFLKRRQG